MGALLGEQAQIRVNRGQADRAAGGDGNVVETDYSQILRHTQAQSKRDVDDGNRHDVVGGKNRGWPSSKGEEPRGGLATRPNAEIAKVNLSFIQREAEFAGARRKPASRSSLVEVPAPFAGARSADRRGTKDGGWRHTPPPSLSTPKKFTLNSLGCRLTSTTGSAPGQDVGRPAVRVGRGDDHPIHLLLDEQVEVVLFLAGISAGVAQQEHESVLARLAGAPFHRYQGIPVV